MNKVNTILFDLDGTLLPMDMDKFMKIYFDEMGKYFVDLIDPDKLIPAVWEATKEMVTNTEYKTNEEVFMKKFEKLIPGDLDTYKERFDKFYDEMFVKAKEAILENALMRNSVEILKEKEYDLVIATNPLFPESAILQRIDWAGLDASDFSIITCYERNHYCKPQVQFYDEILQTLGKQSQECMMVGNDVQEDMIASQLGMKTFLIKDHIIHRTDEEIDVDYIGDYQGFYDFVRNMPYVNK